MAKLIATTQATVGGVVDPVGEWVQPDGDHGEHSIPGSRTGSRATQMDALLAA